MKKKLLLLTIFIGSATIGRAQKATAGETGDVDFLYASMPLCDKADYPRSFFEANAATTRLALSELPWGKMLSPTLVNHFVLPLRVNNEPLDSFRLKYYRELRDRVSGLSMTQAALEVNHWCHEHVTYQPSDGRTSSPLQSLRTAFGRCGEESTLCVAAMRTVGIPARQVYTPRWAHTDDNHAWVEVWTDGKWHFLGACEPEPVLDLGWFNAPASRALLMHTKVFGQYDGPEEVVLRTPTYTEINVTANYAPTSKVGITVMQNGKPVADARVEFKIYNYAEFYTAVTRFTLPDGTTSLSGGRGDMLVWASKNERYGFKKVSFETSHTDTINLSLTAKDEYQGQFEISAPAQCYTLPHVSPEARSLNDRRLAFEDSLRQAYVATMPTVAKGSSEMEQRLFMSRGNHQVVRDFISRHGDAALPLLRSLSEKDLRDVTAAVLNDHQLNSPRRKGVSNAEYESHVLCPRVSLEPLTPYKQFFQHENFRFAKAGDVRIWCEKNLRIDGERNSNGTFITPIGVYRTRVCDERSRNVFFVSVCRANGIPAWLDPVTGEVKAEGKTVVFSKAAGTDAREANASLTLRGAAELGYYTRFTLGHMEGGTSQLLTFPEDATLGSMDKAMPMVPGAYTLTTGTRRPNGNVLANFRIFQLEAGKETAVEVTPPSAPDTTRVHGHIDGVEAPCVVALLAVGQEPSNHVIRDIAARSREFDRVGIPVVCCFPSDEQLRKFRHADFPTMPKQTQWVSDGEGKLHEKIARALPLHNASNLPIVIYVDGRGDIIFYRQGYTIGIGDELLKHCKE